MPVTALVTVLLACAWAEAGEPGSPAPPAKSMAPAKLVDQALEMLGETEKVPDVYRKE